MAVARAGGLEPGKLWRQPVVRRTDLFTNGCSPQTRCWSARHTPPAVLNARLPRTELESPIHSTGDDKLVCLATNRRKGLFSGGLGW